MDIESILVIPFADGIGDFINLQPLLEAIKKRYPGAAITVAVSEHGGYLANDPALRTVKPAAFNVDAKSTASFRWLMPQKLMAWFAGPLWERELGPFDLVINFFYGWESSMDFARTWTPQVPAVPNVVHSLDCLADNLERELGVAIPWHERRPHLRLREEAIAWADNFWRENGLDDGGPVIGMVPSTNMAIKRWGMQNWLRFDARLHERRPEARTLLFCDKPPERSPEAREFAAAGSSTLPVFTTLDNVAALVERCALLVGVDTGLLHMAGALDVSWIGLFGPTNPEVTGPYDLGSGISLVARYPKPESCASCWKRAFKYEDDRCRTIPDGSCMGVLPLSTVLNSTLQLLDNPAGAIPAYAASVLAPQLASPLAAGVRSGFFQNR